jgi:hypothetical protein
MRRAMGRRRFLGASALLASALPRKTYAASDKAPSESESDTSFDVLDWKLGDPGDLSHRVSILVPRGLAPDQRLPVLILLHGLGETTNETAGMHAWVERYGLLTAHSRLSRPPVLPVSGRGDLTPERARAISEALKARPFGGRMIFVCPFTPNVWHSPDPAKALDRFADWMTGVLLPEVRSKTPARASPAYTAIDGCSLGGFIGLETFLRKPAVFGSWGGVQSALREGAVPSWADRIALAVKTTGLRHLHIETSRGDPFYTANIALSRELTKKGVTHELAVLPGPHDQPWLREAGTLEMLLWHDRVLSGG